MLRCVFLPTMSLALIPMDRRSDSVGVTSGSEWTEQIKRAAQSSESVRVSARLGFRVARVAVRVDR